MQEQTLTTEQEAAVCILFACAFHQSTNLSQSQIEHLSRMLVLSSKFAGTSLNDLTVKALSLQTTWGSKKLVEEAAPLISDEFRETLFAMCCELVTQDGTVADDESELLGMVALYLSISMENMKMILTTYLIRNRWNVQIIEQE